MHRPGPDPEQLVPGFRRVDRRRGRRKGTVFAEISPELLGAVPPAAVVPVGLARRVGVAGGNRQGAVDKADLLACVKALNAKGVANEGDRRHWHLTAYRYQLPGSSAERHLVVADRCTPPGEVHLNTLV